MCAHVVIASSAYQAKVLVMNENRIASGCACALCSPSYQLCGETAPVFVTHLGNIFEQRLKRALEL
jgi:hypothetical protein